MRPSKKRFFVLLFFAFLFWICADVSILAQSPRPQPTPVPCPSVNAISPDTVNPGQPITFTANVSGGDPNVTPTYHWMVSAGTISSGQGTSAITVDTTGVSSTITATVDVGGFAMACSTSSSSTTSVIAKHEPRKIDEFGKISSKDRMPRLDSLIIEMNNDPTSQGYIISYGGRQDSVGAAQKSADFAKQYIVQLKRFDSSRIVTVDGGFREEPMMELWLVPSGAAPPQASPTVDPSEIKPAKNSKKPAATSKKKKS
jgi:hypothetical protein